MYMYAFQFVSSCFVVFSQKIIVTLTNDEMNCSSLIGRFQEYLEYDDVRYFTMKSLSQLLKDHKEKVHVRAIKTNNNNKIINFRKFSFSTSRYQD